jgi:hypothetical protein
VRPGRVISAISSLLSFLISQNEPSEDERAVLRRLVALTGDIRFVLGPVNKESISQVAPWPFSGREFD